MDGQQTNLIRDIREEQNRHVACGNVRKIGIKLATNREIIRSKIELADNEELAIGADLDLYLAIKDLFRSVDSEHFSATGNRHRRSKRSSKPIGSRIGLYALVLIDNLILDLINPLLRRQVCRRAKFRIA